MIELVGGDSRPRDQFEVVGRLRGVEPFFDDAPRLADAQPVEQEAVLVPEMHLHQRLTQLDRAARAAHADAVLQLDLHLRDGGVRPQALFRGYACPG